MFCPKCGNQQNSGAYCRRCGTPMQVNGTGNSYVNNQSQYYAQQPNPYNPPPYYNGYNAGPYGAPQPCGFDGSGGEFFLVHLVNCLVLILTCFLAFPWVLCRNLRWRKSHTIINGRRLAFTGTAGELFGKWFLWWLLSIITCGIYALWVSVKIKEWEISHTCYADMNPSSGQTFEDSYYDGGVGERFGQQLLCNLLTVLTCGIYRPWACVRMLNFDTAHSVINGDRMRFEGTGSGYWGENAIVGILTLVTCGIYAPWGVCRVNKWTYKNTKVASRGNRKMNMF